MIQIEKNNTCAVQIDIQEKLFPVMHESEELLERCQILIQGLNTLQVPIIVTEQYPKGLGKTLNSISEFHLPNVTPIEKITFSCGGSNAFVSKLNWINKDIVIVFGIEAHVCVLQTVLDLVELGKTPVVISDCIRSRKPEDKDIAMQRMIHSGAVISTSESILLELCKQAGTDNFKTISKLIR